VTSSDESSATAATGRLPGGWKAWLAKAGTWSAVAVGTLLSVWFGAEHVHALVGGAVAWLTKPGVLPNWVCVLAVGIVATHAVFGVLALRRRRGGERKLRPEWDGFRRGVFGTIAWSWKYSDEGEPVEVAVFCPADNTRMGIRNEGITRARGFVSLVCPLCERHCRISAITFDNAQSVITAEIETDRWRDHGRTFLERLRELKEAIGEARNWNGGGSLEDVRVDRDRQAEASRKNKEMQAKIQRLNEQERRRRHAPPSG
jgi:hypothetical protein